MIIVTDILNAPFDEGAKVATKNLVENIKTLIGVFIVSLNSFSRLPDVDAYFQTNKLLFNLPLYKTIRKQPHTKILYIPEASVTLFSIVRAKLLSLFTRKNVFLLALQPREYTFMTKYIIRTIQPKLVITQSNLTARYLAELGIKNTILPLGVDDNKYRELDANQKKVLREKFQLEPEKMVLLHVGHIQKSRNLDWLTHVKKHNQEIEVIIVGSTYNQDDEELYSTLINSGIRIFREYSLHMEDIYNLADYYIFPVLRRDGAIETPLSVLEAMACNLPVITSRFGSLPELFVGDDDFHYVNSGKEIIDIIKKPKTTTCNNRDKVNAFTWKKIAQQLIETININ